jgi:hypothetical protein
MELSARSLHTEAITAACDASAPTTCAELVVESAIGDSHRGSIHVT